MSDIACITGLFLLDAFSRPPGEPCKQSGVFMVPWKAISELCVPVTSPGAG